VPKSPKPGFVSFGAIFEGVIWLFGFLGVVVAKNIGFLIGVSDAAVQISRAGSEISEDPCRRLQFIQSGQAFGGC